MIQIVPLGGGQDVGRSCVLVTIGGRNIMFDCGMHMGYNDERKFPDFTYISRTGRFDEALDAVIITHFHLDHCGALPHFTETCGFSGPVVMTYPTRATCPILLEDYRKIATIHKKESNFFTVEDISNCMRKVTCVNFQEVVKIKDMEIRAFYAGHVLGAAMFYVKVGNESVVYTGDYNMTPDRHLGSAWIDKLRPDCLITETTYATTIRDSKRTREREFLTKLRNCVLNGGKVIIPVFALGRAQELCILVETYWERMGLDVPVYFSGGMTAKANYYYRLFINFTSQKIKETFADRNMFEFKHIKPFEMKFADQPGPMVLFATPGMLHSGFSLEVFKKWAPNPENMVILPGYCVAGTVGAKVLAGQKIIEDKKSKIHVNLKVENLSFSAHADAKGIMQLIKMCEPKNVVLVHGEKSKMVFLKEKIVQEFKIPCFDPANGQTINVETRNEIPVEISLNALKACLKQKFNGQILNQPNNGVVGQFSETIGLHENYVRNRDKHIINAAILTSDYQEIQILTADKLATQSNGELRNFIIKQEIDCYLPKNEIINRLKDSTEISHYSFYLNEAPDNMRVLSSENVTVELHSGTNPKVSIQYDTIYSDFAKKIIKIINR